MNANDPTPAVIRAQLCKQRQELLERLSRIDHDRHRGSGPLPADFADQAVIRENDEVLDRLDEATTARVIQIDRALQHLDEGTYGHCELCGESIAPVRLQAMPEATTCQRCAVQPGSVKASNRLSAAH